MAVYSMTGYASVQFTGAAAGEGGPGNARRLGLEIRSVNSRFPDLSLRLSDELRAQEPALRARSRSSSSAARSSCAPLDSAEFAALAEPTPRLLQRVGTVQDTVRLWLPDAAP